MDERDLLKIEDIDSKMLDIIKELNYFVANPNYRYMYGVGDDSDPNEIVELSSQPVYPGEDLYDAGSHSLGTKAQTDEQMAVSCQELRDQFIEKYGRWDFGGILYNQKIRDNDTSNREDSYVITNDGRMVYMAFEAIKELSKQVDKLQSELSSLKSDNK